MKKFNILKVLYLLFVSLIAFYLEDFIDPEKQKLLFLLAIFVIAVPIILLVCFEHIFVSSKKYSNKSKSEKEQMRTKLLASSLKKIQ